MTNANDKAATPQSAAFRADIRILINTLHDA
jgi:hypothetical protein